MQSIRMCRACRVHMVYLSYGLNIAAGIDEQVSGVWMFSRQPAYPHENVPRQIRVVTTAGQVPRDGYHLKSQHMFDHGGRVNGGFSFSMLWWVIRPHVSSVTHVLPRAKTNPRNSKIFINCFFF